MTYSPTEALRDPAPKSSSRAPSNIGEAGQKKEAARDRVNQAGGNIHAAAFLGGVKPDVIKIGLGLWRDAVRH